MSYLSIIPHNFEQVKKEEQGEIVEEDEDFAAVLAELSEVKNQEENANVFEDYFEED